MKVVAFNGSPRAAGNTFGALSIAADILKEEQIDTEIVQIGTKPVSGCVSCFGCVKNHNMKCVLPGDSVNDWLEKMVAADGIILATPVHFSAIAAAFNAFLDRAFFVATANKNPLRHKVGAALAVVRRSGGIPTSNQLHNYLLYSEMFIASSNYWNVIHGMNPGEIEQDEEGLQIIRLLARNTAWLLKAVTAGKQSIPLPEVERKKLTNFVR